MLMAAAAFGAEQLWGRAPSPPNVVAIFSRKSAIEGTRWIVVTGWDVPGGAQISVEAWLEASSGGTTMEFSANPSSIVAGFPRRNFFRLVVELLHRMGLPDDRAQFRHG